MLLPRIVPSSVALLLTIGVSAAAQAPPGWRGTPGTSGLDSLTAYGGRSSGFVRASDTTDLATLRQAFQPDSVRGQRVRFRAMVRTELETGHAALWMRVDGQEPMEVLAFDNMNNRPIRGHTPWTAYEIVLDVPPAASLITFGLLQTGRGQGWIDEVQFEIVDRGVASTDLAATMKAQGEHVHPMSPTEREQILATRRRAPPSPVNLNFERRP